MICTRFAKRIERRDSKRRRRHTARAADIRKSRAAMMLKAMMLK
jgi:hypothetical protein